MTSEIVPDGTVYNVEFSIEDSVSKAASTADRDNYSYCENVSNRPVISISFCPADLTCTVGAYDDGI